MKTQMLRWCARKRRFTVRSKGKADRLMKKALTVTISVGVALNAVAFMFAVKPRALWQFLSILLLLGVLATILVNLILVSSLWNRHKFRAFIPFCVALLCLGSLVPSLSAGYSLRDHIFRSRLGQYEAVIGLMMDGSIEVGEKLHKVELPPKYSNLAMGMLAEKDSNGVLTVEFIIGGGFPLKHSGYLYRSEGTLEDWRHVSRWPVRRKMDNHWYRISD